MRSGAAATARQACAAGAAESAAAAAPNPIEVRNRRRVSRVSLIPASVAARTTRRNVEIPGLCSAGGRELAGELGPRADRELPVDLRQRRLDGAVGEDEDGRDLPVRLALGDEA